MSYCNWGIYNNDRGNSRPSRKKVLVPLGYLVRLCICLTMSHHLKLLLITTLCQANTLLSGAYYGTIDAKTLPPTGTCNDDPPFWREKYLAKVLK